MNAQLLQDVNTIVLNIDVVEDSSKSKLYKSMLKFSASIFEPQGYEALQDWECMYLLNKLDYLGKVTVLHSQSPNESLVECYEECEAIADRFGNVSKIKVSDVNNFIRGLKCQ